MVFAFKEVEEMPLVSKMITWGGEYHMSSGSSGKRVIEPPLHISLVHVKRVLFCEVLFD